MKILVGITRIARVLQRHLGKNDARPEWVEERMWDVHREMASHPTWDFETGWNYIPPKEYIQYGD